jgi:hypothetical protein
MRSTKTYPARISQGSNGSSGNRRSAAKTTNLKKRETSHHKTNDDTNKSHHEKTPNTKSHDLHLLAMKGLISYYETISMAKGSSKMINTELIQMNRGLFEKNKPQFNPELDYRSLLFDECQTQEKIKVCLGEALV